MFMNLFRANDVIFINHVLVHKSEPELVSTSLIRPGEILKSVAQSLFTMNEHMIAIVAAERAKRVSSNIIRI